VGPRGGAGQRGGQRGSPRKWVDCGGKKAVAHRRSKAAVGSGSQKGGQWDRAAIRERERSADPAGQWKAATEVVLTEAG
jgi:hypothetical protein